MVRKWRTKGNVCLFNARYVPTYKMLFNPHKSAMRYRWWWCLVTKSCLTLLWPCGLCNWPVSSVHGFPRQRYWCGLSFPSPGSLPDPDWTHVSCVGRWVPYSWAIREARRYYCLHLNRLERLDWDIRYVPRAPAESGRTRYIGLLSPFLKAWLPCGQLWTTAIASLELVRNTELQVPLQTDWFRDCLLSVFSRWFIGTLKLRNNALSLWSPLSSRVFLKLNQNLLPDILQWVIRCHFFSIPFHF